MTYPGRKRPGENELAFSVRRPERALLPESGEQRTPTLILHPDRRDPDHVERRSLDARLGEAEGLANAIGLGVRQIIPVPVRNVRPATYFGKGKVEELGRLIAESGIELVYADCQLSPIQQRNLERTLKCKVIDRTGLILEIFGERAETKEGRLQVELAHLTYQRSRLVRSWTHLERQRGGVGFMGGPGERQIEADRRMIDEKITKIRQELKSVKRTRGLHRRERQKVPYPVIAFVGYTNAGKSTLFNRLTGAEVMAKDILFATLDPTARAIETPSGRTVILSDTVGFVSNLPTQLIAAFRATLEEVLEADIILHVRDMADPENRAQRDDVHHVLAELGIGESDPRPVIEVLNKIDLLDADQKRAVEAYAGDRENALAVSAMTGAGTDALLARIEDLVARNEETLSLSLRPEDGELLAWLYRHGDVLERTDGNREVAVTVRLSAADIGRLKKEFPAAETVAAPCLT